MAKAKFDFSLCPTCKSSMVEVENDRVDFKCTKCDTKVYLDAATNPAGDSLPIVVSGNTASIYDPNAKPEWFEKSN